jgi:predicted Abi (CAAX) family protease
VHPRQGQLTVKQSNYAIHTQQSFNQPSYYPINKTPSNLYQPIADWVGRLILPQVSDTDWVWLEVQHAPDEMAQLTGKIVRLEWTPESKSYVKTVNRDVRFTAATQNSELQGNIHPARLNNRLRVGPLQSLAGSRPDDNTIVTLENPKLINQSDGKIVLQIDSEPVLATGRFYGLVKILNSEGEFFQVQHYNRNSSKFDGGEERIRIPQQVIDTRNIYPSTPSQLATSPAGNQGWYIYGANNSEGIFVVQALVPRSLLQLQPNQLILGYESGLSYIKERNWQNTEVSKGTSYSVLLEPTQAANPRSNWQLGDQAIALHLFGGIGGRKGEALGVPGTVTGHFAFGLAEVVREPLANELQFNIQYQQIYAHNPDGIIAGKHSWADYMGNLQWGWSATRPVSDVLINFPPVTQDYNFSGVKISPVKEFLQQLQIMMARYRVGDGSGSSTVTPATSCIQDSSQALYAAIRVIKQKVTTSSIQQWLNDHPKDPQTLRFQQLVSLGTALEQQLSPLGIVRADWEKNADVLIGTEGRFSDGQKPDEGDRSVWAGLTTWRTIMPRRVHDELAALFLKHDAKLWFLRTNQIGGWQADISPIAPTVLLGQIKIPYTEIAPISIALERLLTSLVFPRLKDWLIVSVTLLIYGAITLPLGFRLGLLKFSSSPLSTSFWLALRTFIVPALGEELIFRVLLLPHPLEVVSWTRWIIHAFIVLLIFILYHRLTARAYSQPIFLLLTAPLGLACTVAYALTGSLWAIIIIHWIVVLVWLLLLGGKHKLQLN